MLTNDKTMSYACVQEKSSTEVVSRNVPLALYLLGFTKLYSTIIQS